MVKNHSKAIPPGTFLERAREFLCIHAEEQMEGGTDVGEWFVQVCENNVNLMLQYNNRGRWYNAGNVSLDSFYGYEFKILANYGGGWKEGVRWRTPRLDAKPVVIGARKRFFAGSECPYYWSWNPPGITRVDLWLYDGGRLVPFSHFVEEAMRRGTVFELKNLLPQTMAVHDLRDLGVCSGRACTCGIPVLVPVKATDEPIFRIL
jgi:hypothetical protein